MPAGSNILSCHGDASAKQTQNTTRAVAHAIPKIGSICHTTTARTQKVCEAHKQQSDSQRATTNPGGTCKRTDTHASTKTGPIYRTTTEQKSKDSPSAGGT